jgi:hypothetical protein
MLIRDDTRRPRLGAAAALAGLAAVWLLALVDWRAAPRMPPPAAGGPASPLRELAIAFAPADRAVLAAQRERALATGVLAQDDAAMVPVVVRCGAETAAGRARLKGDWLDHVDSEQWSLRFELDTPLLGMRRFSIQHPKTRGFLGEWLVMRCAQRLGVMAPRVQFVVASVDGGPRRVWYLEEHPAKELIEACGRRDGPIVRFDESGMWGTIAQYGASIAAVPLPLVRTLGPWSPPIAAYGEDKLASIDGWNRRLHRAVEQLRGLRGAWSTEQPARERLRAAQAIVQLDGRTVDDLFASEKVGRWLALLTFFQGFHGLGWHQLRFHHDPVADRLEPIVFDTGSELLTTSPQLAVLSPDVAWFRRSARVQVAAHAALGAMTTPQWAAETAAALQPDVDAVVAAMKEFGVDGGRVDGVDTGQLIDALFAAPLARLPERAQQLGALLRPRHAASFAADLVAVPLPDAPHAVEVRAWSRTEMPVLVQGFRLANGTEVPAASALVGIDGVPGSASLVATLDGGAVLLPDDGTTVVFRFLPDRRMTGLGEVELIKAAIRSGVTGRTDPLQVAVVTRLAADPSERVEPLQLRPRAADVDPRAGRPTGPPLAEALARHPFLVHDVVTDRLLVPAGVHAVAGDVLLPEDRALHLLAGAELVLPPDAVLVAGALRTEGTIAAPVRIRAADLQRGFAGVVVLGSAGPSTLAFTDFRGAREIARGAWTTTGGVTFVGAPATFTDCRFEDALGEDALNLIHVRFRLERCTFARSHSDQYDGDFVTGDVVDCRFEDSGADGLDVSGALVTVRGCTFERIGDKGMSIGEGSTVHATDNHVVSASIAVASKDRSDARIERLRVGGVQHYVAACFVKKPQFGAATMVVSGLHWEGAGPARHVAQTGCSLTVDGAAIATEPIDVEASYRAGVLGK